MGTDSSIGGYYPGGPPYVSVGVGTTGHPSPAGIIADSTAPVGERYFDRYPGDFENDHSLAVFNFLYASYLGDFNTSYNFLRAPLANDGYGLISIYAPGINDFYLSPLGLGGTIGDMAFQSQNNDGKYEYVGSDNQTWHPLMGDPTIRMDVVMPSPGLFITPSGTGVTLSWTASAAEPATADVSQFYYNVYYLNTTTNRFELLPGAEKITGHSFTDSAAIGSRVYMVRAVKLEQTVSNGSYYNASQGTYGTIAMDVGGAASGSTTTPSGGTPMADLDLAAAGSGIGGTADNFHFAYQAIAGDFDLRINVASMADLDTTTAPDARAGLMVRLGTDAGAKMVFVGLDRNGHVLSFLRSTDNATTSTPTTVINTATWVRLRRIGNQFTAFYSKDGVVWTQIGSTATLGSATDGAYVGAAASSQGSSGRVGVEFRGLSQAAQFRILITGSSDSGTGGTDKMYFRLDSTGQNLEMYWEIYGIGAPTRAITLGQPDHIYPLSEISQLLLWPSGGDDEITIDFSQGVFAFTNGITIQDYSSVGNESIDTLRVKTAADNVVEVTSSQITVDSSIIHYLNIEQIIYESSGDAASLTIDTGAKVTFDTPQKLGSLTINGTGTLDIGDNPLVIDYSGSSPLSTIRGLLHSGYDAGTWDGNGIVSSWAASNSSHLAAIGYAEASDFGTLTSWNGLTVDSTSLLLMCTNFGDANLSNSLDGDDYTLIDSGYAHSGGQ